MASQRDLADELLALAADDAVAAEVLLDVGVVTDRIVGFELSTNAGAPLPPGLSEVARLTPFGVGLR